MSNDLSQYFTPFWMAEALVERYFHDLTQQDLVLEPCCGHGAFLSAIPSHVPAIGVEIDPEVAQLARATGRQIILSDFLGQAVTGLRPTAVVGNPPFKSEFIDQMLTRCHSMLPEGGRAGFILPAYFFQAAHTVSDLGERWSIAQEMLPRNAFHKRMQTPLVWALFTKDRRRALVGFALYRESSDVMEMESSYREALATTNGSAWRKVCQLALEHLGGRATLPQIYAQLERNRPTRTQFWREKIRQTLRVYADTFRAIDIGEYEVIKC